jgi:nitrile hydratase
MTHDPHDHDHDHDHHHHDHDHDHPHPLQTDHAEPSSHYELMGIALNQLLQEKGLYTAAELRAQIEAVEAVSVQSHGARVIARAWVDTGFKVALLEDAYAAVQSMGLDAGPAELTALENTAEVHNVVVCTLCSCYPRMLLGRPPLWYKSAAYRSRVVKEPRAVLREFGTVVGDHVQVRVHDSTADLRYLVLPKRPLGSESMSEDELAALVTRDAMIGVSEVGL